MDGWRHKKRNIGMPFRFFKGKRKVPGQRGNSTDPRGIVPLSYLWHVSCILKTPRRMEGSVVARVV